VRSCSAIAAQADGVDIVTVEGLAEPGTLNKVQRAFAKHHALQCGFCTPGILCSVTHFLRDTPAPDERQVRDMLSGHICRCTGYAPIVAAVLEAATSIRKGS
jgi:2-furoyl-CoA dehydrogenase 2Fe-2S iron sulfur subunit